MSESQLASGNQINKPQPHSAGTLGSVFRARYEGRTVAVKIVRFKDANGQVGGWIQLALDATLRQHTLAMMVHSFRTKTL